MNLKRLEWDFSYHAPNEQDKEAHETIRKKFIDMAMFINTYAPDSREKSLAITNLEQALFWTNAAIARGDRPEDCK